MLPEILGISVPEQVLALAPSTYGGFSAHAETVRQRKQDVAERKAKKGLDDDGSLSLNDLAKGSEESSSIDGTDDMASEQA